MKILGCIAGFFIVVVLMAGIGFGSGEIQAYYNKTVGLDVVNSETVQFHANKSRVDGMVADLSKQRLELAQTTDITARGAITTYIVNGFSNFDEQQITTLDLRQFLINVRNGSVK